ncbi:MAG: deoxyribodipyrimidine photo-lyase, partial [Hyphomicrobiaceae bacterium]|nr:deoxyribodipyrimidine photo-lyase [Hyphomicrobiaceae bacterium]
VHDNPALASALCEPGATYAVYILEEGHDGLRPPGGASRWWLHHALEALHARLAPLTGGLILKRGSSHTILPQLAEALGVTSIHWNRRYEGPAIELDSSLKSALQDKGLSVKSHNAALLHEPWTVATKTGGPYKVFTPFARACREKGTPDQPMGVPESADTSVINAASGLTLDALELLPRRPDWAGGIKEAWTPGEDGALTALDRFVEGPLARYHEERDIPGKRSTSRLSPHLRFGEISPRLCWHRVETADVPRKAVDKFHSELLWREFSYHLLFHNPDLGTQNFQPRFDAFAWAEPDPETLKRWHFGLTGYPIVDAGMRELWQTGWMHNRVRMVVGSFLVKNLLIDWRHGEDWFWDTLVDADPASNTASWQWIAGSGADAAPYFRIFNPILQGERFDPDGDYVRRFVPELATLPARFIHKPWEADAATLHRAGVRLGETYPRPIIDHGVARDRALAAYADLP